MNKSKLIDHNATKEVVNVDKKIRIEQIQLLYKQTKTSLIGVLIVALTACVVFWEVVPQWRLLLWTVMIVILTLVRAAIVFMFYIKNDLIPIEQWASLHVFGVVASGLLWAIPFVFLWPTDQPIYQFVWIIFVLPLSAAAVATYYTWQASYISFLILTALPISARYFFDGGNLYFIMGLLSLFLIGVLLRAGKVMHLASIRSFENNVRNEVLNIELNKGILIREQLNSQLKQEITERKLAENEIRKLSKVFLEGTNPTFIEDLNGNILDMNNEAVNFYGFSRQELIGKSITLISPKEQHPKTEELIQLCLEGKLVRDIEGLQQTKNGNLIPVLMTMSLLTDENNNPFAIASITSDITQQKNIEKELKKSKAIAEEANATKDKFFKIISHDLRSPFTSIIGLSNLLIEDYDTYDNLTRKDFIQMINSSSLSAFNLLDNLLTWARTQTDEIRINKEVLNLKELVDSTVSIALFNANAKGISIINNVEPELNMLVDKNTILTVVRNLINNAVKFTASGGTITIDTFVNQNDVNIHIIDTGVGMTAEVINHLFKIGKNISTKGTNDEMGTGLGLILSKEFIERNGGSISVKSEVNKGSEFIITLPRYYK